MHGKKFLSNQSKIKNPRALNKLKSKFPTSKLVNLL